MVEVGLVIMLPLCCGTIVSVTSGSFLVPSLSMDAPGGDDLTGFSAQDGGEPRARHCVTGNTLAGVWRLSLFLIKAYGRFASADTEYGPLTPARGHTSKEQQM